MIYFITDKENIKIGYTSGKPERRLKQLNTGSSRQLYLIGYMLGNKKKEKELHLMFNEFLVKGEWFKPDEVLLSYINRNNLLKDKYVVYDEEFYGGLWIVNRIQTND